MAEIKIDSKVFQERISHFLNAWKADKRSGDTLFGGVSSIVILMGKVDANPEFHKNNAMHVCHVQTHCAFDARIHPRPVPPSLTARSFGFWVTNSRRP
jgi:FACT complex subunit SPT16 N-terminal lobe domain